MELRQLEYFRMVSPELHFTKAAENLGIAQPSLSLQIRLLEHEIGAPLFDRIRTCVEVSRLPKDALVEVEAIAYIQGEYA